MLARLVPSAKGQRDGDLSISAAFLRAPINGIGPRDDFRSNALVHLCAPVARRSGLGLLAPDPSGEPKQDARPGLLNRLRCLRRVMLFQKGNDLGVHASPVRLGLFADAIPQAVGHADDVFVLGY